MTTRTNGRRNCSGGHVRGAGFARGLRRPARILARSSFCFRLSYLAGSWFPAEEVWERLRSSAIDVHFLMLAVAAGARRDRWAEGATLLFLFSLSGGLEHYALGRTQKEIRSLFREAPKDGHCAGCKRQRKRGHSGITPDGHALAGETRLAIPGGCRSGERPDGGG